MNNNTTNKKAALPMCIKSIILFIIGGLVYMLFEILFRGYTHWTMGVVGGICFLALGELNEHLDWEMSIILQGLLGACIITVVEFVAGCILNIWLKLDVWDYSNLPFNILGQVCLPFFLLWIPISIYGIWLDDFLRWKLFGEEKPHYHLLNHKKCEDDKEPEEK